MLKIINVVGARPNFMKVAPIVAAMKRREREFVPLLVHTGQHYDADILMPFFGTLICRRRIFIWELVRENQDEAAVQTSLGNHGGWRN
jgi:UDP-N-acetylglucosamine 2-epimerase